MMNEYRISYLKCQSCNAKIHCEECAEELRQRFLKDGIRDIRIDIPNRLIRVDTPDMDEMDLLDLLEEAGVFAD